MSREKAAAEATWGTLLDVYNYFLRVNGINLVTDLKSRFHAKSGKLRAKSTPQVGRTRKPGLSSPYKSDYQLNIVSETTKEAPLLPTELAAQSSKDPKHEMQDFLDDLLG